MWILCSLHKPYDMQHFKDAAFSLSIELSIIDPTKLVILNGPVIKYYYNQKSINPPKYVLNWNGCMNGKLEEQIEASLRLSGTVICNSVNEINHWQDKFKWQVETEMPVARSMKLHSSSLLDNLDIIEQNFSYPLVLKSDTGSLGMGVYKASDRNNLKQLVEVITLLDKTFKVHIEEYINYTNDLRMYIIGNQYYLMERVATDDFRANVAQNATISDFPKTELTDSIFKQIRSSYDAVVIGVDVLLTRDSYIICEINSAPGFTGIEQVHNVNIAEEIISAVINS